MPSFFWTLISLLLKGFLSLRYRIEIKGLENLSSERLTLKGGLLFLPNHPALLDPFIISVWLWPKFRMRPLIIEYMYNEKMMKVVNFISKAIPVPNFDSGVNEWKVKRGEKAIRTIAEGLKAGENFLLYPSGQLKGSGKEVIGGASATHELVNECPTANIVLIRTTGLWGSSFSRALTGKSPPLAKTILSGAKVLLKNFIFFAPRRKILIEIESNPKDFPQKGASRIELNRYLENWYDRYPDAKGAICKSEPVALVSYSRFKQELGKPYKAEKKKNNGNGVQISEETKRRVYGELRRILERPDLEIAPEMTLAYDLGMDSLNIAEFIAFLSKSFGVGQLFPEDLENIGIILEIAQEGRSRRESSREPVTFTFKEEKGRLPPAATLGRTIPEAFLASCQRMGGHAACGDDFLGPFSYPKFKKSVLVLAQHFRKIKEEHVAVMLPSSVGAYLIILALQMAGKIPVMLNWTLGPKYLEEMMKISGAQKIISSWRFLDRLAFVQFGNCIDQLILLEDIRKQLTLKEKLKGIFLTKCSIQYVLKAMGQTSVDENSPCVILFTSGTEAAPKAVPLSHKNIISNHRSALQCFALNEKDVAYGILPPFHSFGFSVVGLLPLLIGMRVAFYPDPTDSFALAEGVNRWKITLFISPPSFLKRFFQVAKLEQIRSVKMFISGAEKAPQELFDRVLKLNTGAKLLEGYGITECSPMLTLTRVNLPPVGVGQFLPNVEMITIHPETQTVLAKGEDGEICVRGDNVFSGYLNNTKDPFIEIDGKKWYRTGDLGHLDANENLIISGRLKRFTKLGAEMISLGAIEETLAKSLLEKNKISADVPSLAVCAIEKEVGSASLVLFSIIELSVDEVNEILQKGGFSNLVKISSVKKVDEIPIMGAGKTDYRKLQDLC